VGSPGCCLSDRQSGKYRRCFTLGHFEKSVPSSLINGNAGTSSIPSMAVKSMPTRYIEGRADVKTRIVRLAATHARLGRQRRQHRLLPHLVQLLADHLVQLGDHRLVMLPHRQVQL
jgi:hypothetical protein